MSQISLISQSRLLPFGCSRRVLCFGAGNDNSRVTDLSPVSTAVLVVYCVLESGTMILVSQISRQSVSAAVFWMFSTCTVEPGTITLVSQISHRSLLAAAFWMFSLCTVFWSRER